MHRAILAALTWLLLATQALATYVQGASNTATTSVASVTATFGAGVGSGHTVWGVVSFDSSNGSTLSVTVGGTTATILDSATDAGNGITSSTFILGNVTGSPTTVVASFSPNNDTIALIAIEESGTLAASNPTDVHTGRLQSSSGTGANVVTSGNVTTTVANDIIVGAAQINGNTTAPTAGTTPLAFTLRTVVDYTTVLPLSTEDGATKATAGTAAATFGTTASSNFNVFVIAIKPAVAATCPNTRATTGVGC